MWQREWNFLLIFVVFISATKCLVHTKNSTKLNGESWYLLVTYGAIIGQQGKAKKSQFWGLSTMLNKPQKWTESRKVNKTPKTVPKGWRKMENQFAHIHLDMWQAPEQRSEQLVESKKEEGKGHRERRITYWKLPKKGNFSTKPYPQTVNPNPKKKTLSPNC